MRHEAKNGGRRGESTGYPSCLEGAALASVLGRQNVTLRSNLEFEVLSRRAYNPF
jgi:hypothetical protein